MAYQKQSTTGGVDRVAGSTSLADVIDRILDKGLVIDAWIRVSLVGFEILTVEARVVVASVDTYLRFADAISRMPLASAPPTQAEPEAPPEQRQLPSAQEIRHYLEESGEGMSLDKLAAHFGAPREALAERLRGLVSAGGVIEREGHS
jgi:gas vesicle structural protein